MGTNAVYQNVISSNCEIGDLRGAWNAIWDKYDSMKPAMQSQLAQEFSNCLHMPDETVEQFINRLNDICARMVNDPGEAMKKTQVINGICNEFAALVQIETRRDMSWAEYCTSINDQAMQFADISLFPDKRKQMIAAERARQSSSNRLDGNEDSVKIDDSVNFASDGVQNKKRDSDAKSSVRCWKCDRQGHKSFECPHREKKKRNRRGDAYEDRRRKLKKLRVRVDDSDGTESDVSASD